ncbi:MAG: Glu-tRNA(Gln) amidotransferase subunit GatE, partial [Candidatus Aenigmarchaeota archaeon]|nr:Glu-tRNA(Gln) amidotransferase subunit GatE [Candidatus Aenigmarchaeota archaeon]MDI6722200.1 Glu-tRNA(Gln) amidotransferase subunit GatE [Candidatus Aenigmarchaeota archaeon]
MDYSSLGLRIGLEIHQQLASGKKLFCDCPVPSTTDNKNDNFPIEIRRKLRPVAGETGDVDIAALHEFLRDRIFVYRTSIESSCLVETDEQPPKPLNTRALEIAMQICKLLNCKILDEVHVMRKTVIDGSSVSGFQRTAFLGMNGYIDTTLGKIGVKSISLEEDSAAPVEKNEGYVEYRLDRLGIPLVEIATTSDIKSPSHAKEVAEEIGLLLRSTGVVRGIGSVRQDINISIEKGSRIEIKGFQDLDKIPEVIENEIQRQLSLAEIKDELLRRGAKPFDADFRIVTHLFHGTECSFIKKSLEKGATVIAGKLPLFDGLLKKQCGNSTFGKELSCYAEVFGYGITHSDEDLEKYRLVNEFPLLKNELNAGERDVIFIIAGSNPINAVNLVIRRANHCLIGVPEETRVADGIGSRFTRPLPGAGRMYPESDIPPIKLAKKYIDSIKIPKTLSEIRKELEKEMPKELALQIVRSHYFKEFESLSKNYDKTLAATVFTSYFKDLSRRGIDVSSIRTDDIEKILSAVKEGSVPKDAVLHALEKLASGENIVKILASYHSISNAEIISIVKEAVAQNPGKKESVIMGIVMQKFRGRASGDKV